MLKDKIRKKNKVSSSQPSKLAMKVIHAIGPVNFLSQILFFYLIIQQ